MNRAGTIDPLAPQPALHAATAAAIAALVAAGFFGLSDVRVSALVTGAFAVCGWAALAWQFPSAALRITPLLLLLAGTKLRLRDPDASVEGLLDAQVAAELLLFGIVAIAVAAAFLGSPRARTRTGAAEVPMWGYAAVVLLSVSWSVAPVLTATRAMQLVILAGLASVAVRMLTPHAALRLVATSVAVFTLGCAALAATVPAAHGVYTDSYDEFNRWSGRLAWFAVHPIEVGSLAAVGALALLTTRAFGKDRWWRTGAFVALVAVLVLTQSRGPIVAFAAGLAAFLFLRAHAAVKIPLAIAGFLVLLMILVVPPDLGRWLEGLSRRDSAVTQFVFRNQSPDKVLALSGRLELWDEVRPAASARPLGGYGYQASRPVLLAAVPWAAFAHNALMQTLLDLGAAGVLMVAALIAITLGAAFSRRLDRPLKAAVVSLTVLLVVNSLTTESFAGRPGIELLVLFLCASIAASGSRTRV